MTAAAIPIRVTLRVDHGEGVAYADCPHDVTPGELDELFELAKLDGVIFDLLDDELIEDLGVGYRIWGFFKEEVDGDAYEIE